MFGASLVCSALLGCRPALPALDRTFCTFNWPPPASFRARRRELCPIPSRYFVLYFVYVLGEFMSLLEDTRNGWHAREVVDKPQIMARKQSLRGKGVPLQPTVLRATSALTPRRPRATDPAH